MSSHPSLIWFLLLDSTTGLPYKDTSVSSILRSSLVVPVIDQFRDAVKAKNSNKLSSFDAADLIFYKNKSAFDIRHADADDRKEEPLKPSRSLDGLGTSEDEALIVVVPSSMANASPAIDVANRLTFVEYLKLGHINRPNNQVLNIIANRYSQQLQAVLSVGSIDPCIDLYNTVKELPSSFTRGVIEADLKISINGPMSLAQPNILIAADLIQGKFLYIKLLSIPETLTSQSLQSRKNAVDAEIAACTTLSEANIPGLVKCDVVKVHVQHVEDLKVSLGEWAALKMKRYMSALADTPQLSEDWLYRGFIRIYEALKAMHELKLVHMDVKSDNVFVDENLQWDLGDFGSARAIGVPMWSCTEVLNPYTIPANATVIPAMDYVLLCVMIAIEVSKNDWKHLCGQRQKVQVDLIRARLNSIQDDHFKEEVVALFDENLETVLRHLHSR